MEKKLRRPAVRCRPSCVLLSRIEAAAAACELAMSLVGCACLVRQGTIIYLEAESHLGGTEIEIEIRRSFLERYADRVTIDTGFTVDEARSTPNPDFADGDLHFAGRTPNIGLPTVAEIANAASHPKTVVVFDQAAKTGVHLHVCGVPRESFAGLVQRVRAYARHLEALAENLPYGTIILGVSGA